MHGPARVCMCEYCIYSLVTLMLPEQFGVDVIFVYTMAVAPVKRKM